MKMNKYLINIAVRSYRVWWSLLAILICSVGFGKMSEVQFYCELLHVTVNLIMKRVISVSANSL